MDKTIGAVVGSSVTSFLPGVTVAQRNSVALALLQAERETRFVHEQGQIQDWYSYYKNKLKFYGWDAVPASEIHWPDNLRSERVDRALQAISAVAGNRYASSTEVAMHALKNDASALQQFEQRTRQYGVFQLLPCAPISNGSVEMVLYHEALEQSQTQAGFLFRQRRHQLIRAELVRFNVRLFDQQFRSKVEKSLQSVALQEIIDLHV